MFCGDAANVLSSFASLSSRAWVFLAVNIKLFQLLLQNQSIMHTKQKTSVSANLEGKLDDASYSNRELTNNEKTNAISQSRYVKIYSLYRQ
jgi:hypothetical protein